MGLIALYCLSTLLKAVMAFHVNIETSCRFPSSYNPEWRVELPKKIVSHCRDPWPAHHCSEEILDCLCSKSRRATQASLSAYPYTIAGFHPPSVLLNQSAP
ncbi:hypothetical protein IWZ01DRAFT_493579 [Phyllosticta capitalensis]